MPAFLVPLEIEHLLKSMDNGTKFYWYNDNLNFFDGIWVTGKTIQKFKKTFTDDLSILAEVPDKPIYFGTFTSEINRTESSEYQEALTAICISRNDGNEIQAISYMHPFWNDGICFDLKRCFRFKIGTGPDCRWHIIGHFGDAIWLTNQWGEESDFPKWLKKHKIRTPKN